MYNIILTDDPTNWPWHAFLNLPLIPLTLLLARTPFLDAALPLATPFFLAWPTSAPARPTHSLLSSHFSSAASTRPSLPAPTFPLNLLRWPPPPLAMLFLIPFVRMQYGRLLARVRHWALGTRPARRPASVNRLVWDLNEMPFPVRIRMVANLADEPAPEPAPDANADPQERQQPEDGNADPNAAAAEAAERAVHITHLSLGRMLLETLALPYIANRLGRALYRLSARSSALYRLLAIKTPPLRPGTSPAARPCLSGCRLLITVHSLFSCLDLCSAPARCGIRSCVLEWDE
jgi:hypothetical protein